MNLDNCNKCNCFWGCNKKDDFNYYLYCIKPNFLTRFSHVNISNKQFLIIKNNSLSLNCLKVKFGMDYVFKPLLKNELSASIKNIEINKTCPYYIEHQISDWSEKNDRQQC